MIQRKSKEMRGAQDFRRRCTNKPAGKCVCDSQAPDMSSAEDFPTFGSGIAPKQTSAWGPKKFWKRARGDLSFYTVSQQSIFALEM